LEVDALGGVMGAASSRMIKLPAYQRAEGRTFQASLKNSTTEVLSNVVENPLFYSKKSL
jgi:hypothetical protein